MGEDYIRPPVFAIEPPSRQFVKWRFRVAVAALWLLLAVIVFLIVHALVASGGESDTAPTVGVGISHRMR